MWQLGGFRSSFQTGKRLSYPHRGHFEVHVFVLVFVEGQKNIEFGERLGAIVAFEDRPRSSQQETGSEPDGTRPKKQRKKQDLLEEAVKLTGSTEEKLRPNTKAQLADLIRTREAAIRAHEAGILAEKISRQKAAAQRSAPLLQDVDLAIEAHLPPDRSSSSRGEAQSLVFPISLPSLKTFDGCDASPAHSTHVPRDMEESISIDRPPHPVTKSRLCLLCHDRFHGSSHKACQHRDPSLIAELALLNTSFQEQSNRGIAHCAMACPVRLVLTRCLYSLMLVHVNYSSTEMACDAYQCDRAKALLLPLDSAASAKSRVMCPTPHADERDGSSGE